MMGMASNLVVPCAKALSDFRRKNRGEAKLRLPPRCQLPRYPVGRSCVRLRREVFLGLAEGGLFQFDTLAQNAFDPTLQVGRAMQAGQESRPCCQVARN